MGRTLSRNLARSLALWAGALGIGLVTFFVFLPAVHHGLLNWDDSINLVTNPNYRGLGLKQIKWMWTNHLMEHYVPLTWMTFSLDYHFWRGKPFGFHLTNIVLHAANAALFFLLALTIFRLTLGRRSDREEPLLVLGAALASLFFGLHPLRVESVAWVTERRDVLSGFFYLLAILAYLRAFRIQEGERPEQKYYWACFMAFLAAVLSKEIAVTMPVVLIVLDYYPLRRFGPRWFGGTRIWLEKMPFFAVSLADAAITLFFAARQHDMESIATLGWLPRIAITVYDLAFYPLKTIFPSNLSPLYPLTRHKIALMSAPFLISASFVVAATWFVIAVRRRYPGLLAAWVAYVVTILPVSGIFHNGFQIAADRYTYLSCLSLALLLGAAIVICLRMVRFPATRGALLATALIVLALLGWRTRVQLRFWRDSTTLWSRAISIEPSALALNNFGSVLLIDGDSLGALDLFRRAVAMDSKYALAHANMGLALFDLHAFNEAARQFRIAEELKPDFAEAYNSLGNVLRMQGNLDQAIAQYRRAIALKPDYPGAQRNLESALKASPRQFE